jgi:hypothetical protein
MNYGYSKLGVIVDNKSGLKNQIYQAVPSMTAILNFSILFGIERL